MVTPSSRWSWSSPTQTNGAEPGAEGGVHFLVDDVVRLAEEGAAFAVADDDVFHV